MTTKSIAYLFLLLSIMNIPLYMTYNFEDQKSGDSGALSDLFFKYSIGNIGSKEPYCAKTGFNQAVRDEYGDITFKCEDGKMTDMKMFGFPLEPAADCAVVSLNHKVNAWKEFILKRCNFNDGLFKTKQAQDIFMSIF